MSAAERGKDGRFRRPGKSDTTAKLSPERKAAIIAGMELGLSRGDAAQSAGVTRRTVNRWAAEESDFADELEMAESRAKRHLLGIVVAVAAKRFPNTWQAAAWLLERRWPSEFAQKSRLDISIDLEAEIRQMAEEHGLAYEDVVNQAEVIIAEHVADKRIGNG